MVVDQRRRQAMGLVAGVCSPLGWAAEADAPASPGGGTAAARAGAPGASGPAAAVAATRLPLGHFARLPLIASAALAPDGQRFAALMNHGDHTLVVVRELAGRHPLRPVLKTDNREFRFAWIRWVNPERLLVSAAYPSSYGSTEIAETRLFSIRRDGSGLVNLVRRSGFASQDWFVQFQDQVIDWLPGDGQHVLMQLADDTGTDPLVYRVNVENGRRTVVQGPRNHVRRWITDGQHRVRVCVQQKDAEVQVALREADAETWRTAWSFDAFGREAAWPLGFGADPQRLFVRAYHQDRQAVFEVDLSQPALPRRLLLSDASGDVDGDLLLDPRTGAAVGLQSAAGTRLWQADAQQLLQAVDRALPQRVNRLMGFDRDGSRYLLHSEGRGEPGQFLVGFRDQGDLTVLADTYPELADQRLARKQAMELRARDGKALPVVLTLPPQHDPSRRLPTVVMRAGDPVARDGTVFDPLVFFLADRGYAVLQVRTRGSLGLGAPDGQTGLQRWGQEAVDELTDGLQALVARGIADPARAAVAGGAEGGHAALMALVRTPRQYRCGISFAGISDLVELGQRARRFLNAQAVFERSVGSLWEDSDALKAASPQRQVDRIQVPVLLVHGTADRQVPVSQSEGMADALQRAGKPHQFIRQAGGDHHLSHQAHRTQYFQALEAFLDTHLGSV